MTIRTDREKMAYDVLIVGAGPAGLACAIRLKQLAQQAGQELSVCIVEKGSAVGAHLLSGAVLDPRALFELFPNWQELGLEMPGAPLATKVAADKFYFLTKENYWRLPAPPSLHNHGNYIISLGALGAWLAAQAESMGVEIYAGFAAAEILYDDAGTVIGVATGDMGVDRHGNKTSAFTAGVELHAKQTVLAEGARGSLTKTLFEKLNLRAGVQPQTYSLGIKEVWEVAPEQHQRGLVIHSLGWPMDSKTYGGGWCYHYGENLVSVGYVTALDYANPWLEPFAEMQRYKTHKLLRDTFKGARRVGYGARAISSGGLQALPQLSFAGGLLIGDCAGFLNVPKIKGNHAAMKSGMLAAEALFPHLSAGKDSAAVTDYQARFAKSWLYDELYRARNVKPAFKHGLWAGLLYSALDQYILRGKAPWTFGLKPDYASLMPAARAPKIVYDKPDGVLTFDKLSSVFLSNTNHAEDQPVHLQLARPEVAIDVNYAHYASPESRYCPAGVYEIVGADAGAPRLQINAQNCVHCKTCDIKDPTQNINWVVPEGGGGPNYVGM